MTIFFVFCITDMDYLKYVENYSYTIAIKLSIFLYDSDFQSSEK